ncbi:hypothetical protein HDU81_002762 [Chytriomyces hyalinus]|nr:hypothetical protein HDU81_002762 [Chytriomyces hyalinus]
MSSAAALDAFPVDVPPSQDNANPTLTTPLADYRNPTNPVPGPFYPQDKGHIPGKFTIQVPVSIAFGTNYSIVYKYYYPNNNFAVFNQSTLKFLTIDSDPSNWIIRPPSTQGPMPSASSTIIASPGNVDGAGTGVTQSVLVAIIVSLSIAAIALSVLAFFVGRYLKRKRDSGNRNAMASTSDSSRFMTTDTFYSGSTTFERSLGERNRYSGVPYNLDDLDIHSDDEVITFQRSFDRNGGGVVSGTGLAGHGGGDVGGGKPYAASITSKASGASNASKPHSILKKRDIVEREALQAQIYDQVLIQHRQNQTGSRVADLQQPHAKKMVSFKESADAALCRVPEHLFADSDGGSDLPGYAEPLVGAKASGRQVAQGVGHSSVLIDKDDDSEYDSEKDDNDDWRNEQ